MSYNNTIVIDDSIPACANAKIVIKGSNCRIKIGKCRFGNSPYIETFTNSEMNIGDKSSFGHNLKACLTAGTIVNIGEDCMFSNDVELYVYDGKG